MSEEEFVKIEKSDREVEDMFKRIKEIYFFLKIALDFLGKESILVIGNFY